MRVLLFLFLFSQATFAAQITGLVSDADTQEELIGAIVYIESLQASTITGLNGTYLLRNIPKGTYKVWVSYIGYKDIEQIIVIEDDKTYIVNFSMQRDALRINEVTVTARAQRNTELSARESERTSMQVLNVVSASTIELSPDLNIANVVQRISGVTLEKNSSGEAQYAVMRGMDKRYNYTLVNGVKIPSPHNRHRFVPLNIFPSELADRVEVFKTLTPDMEGDGTGGVINLVMKDSPPQYNIQVNAAFGQNSFFGTNDFILFPKETVRKQSPREEYGREYEAVLDDINENLGVLTHTKPTPDGIFGLSVGNRIINKRLGFIVAGNYQKTSKGLTSTYFSESFSQQSNMSVLTSMRERTYTETQDQKGIHLKADYIINPRHTIDWYNAYISMNKWQVRQTTSTSLSRNYDPENNLFDMSFQTRLSTNMQDVAVSSLHGSHAFHPAVLFTWQGMYSTAQNREPQRTYFNLDQIQLHNLNNIYPDADGSTIEWGYNKDRDVSGYANIQYTQNFENAQLEYKVGGMYRDKFRNNSYVEYRIRPDGLQMQGRDFETIDQIVWRLGNPLNGSVGPLEYDAFEKIGAYYGMISFTHTLGTIQGGIRAEETKQGYFQYFPAMGQDSSDYQQYTDYLPSIQIKYILTKNTNLKASYYKSINRPGFFEIVPYLQITEDYLEFGNKELKRAKIDNIDLRFEYFPKQTEQILVGVFYKYIQDPIEVLYTTVNRRQYGYGPGNVGNAQNLGFEADLIKFFRLFGIKANYTFIHSEITTDKTIYILNDNGKTERSSKEQTRPLVGQAPHTGNISLLYKNTKGMNMQVSGSYTHDKLIIVSDFYDSDYWMSKSIQIDASLEKKWDNGFSCFLKINNIFNTPMYYYLTYSNEINEKLPKQDTLPGKTLLRIDEYSRSFLLGVRIKM